MSRERWAMLSVWGLAALACLLGAAAGPSSGVQNSVGAELLDLVRVVSTAALAVTLMLGPGIGWRALGGRRLALGFLALPGLAILAAIGGLAWALSAAVDPRTLAFACAAPLLGLLLGILLAAGPEDLLDGDEQRALMVTSLALILAIAKSLWSIGPQGEFFEGTISRTLNPEGRPDSRISYHVVQLIANGAHPYAPAANVLFFPYNFSSRGPLAGMATAPVVFLSGGRPPLAPPEMPWRPFDPQGFMAYRIAMIAFSCTIFLALWELVRRLGGRRAARFALLLGVGTPFVFADLWFTWPKLLAASFVLLAAILVIERRSFRGGLLVGTGFLVHPSALGGLAGLGPISLWPLRGARPGSPRILSAALLAVGTAILVVFWREINGPHLLQDQFSEYVRQAYPNYHPSVVEWLEFRAHTMANTLIPLFLPVTDSNNISINTVGALSPRVVHFFFQYWTSAPFAFAIVFLPMLLASLWRALRRWTWAVTAAILIPLAAFGIYWGASNSGLLREGLQAWVIAVIAVVALEQATTRFPWFRSTTARVVLVLRSLEVLALAVGATLGTHGLDPLGDYAVTDVAALLAMLLCSLAIARLVWTGTASERA